jgi:hypothetical protein
VSKILVLCDMFRHSRDTILHAESCVGARRKPTALRVGYENKSTKTLLANNYLDYHVYADLVNGATRPRVPENVCVRTLCAEIVC